MNFTYARFESKRKMIRLLKRQLPLIKSKILIYLIECKKCGKQYIQTEQHLHQRFGEYRRSILNYGPFPNPTPVSEYFNQADHSINDALLTPLELICSNRDSVSGHARLTSLTKLDFRTSWYE